MRNPKRTLASSTSDFLFEPSPEAVLRYLLAHYLNIFIYQVLLEAKASEQSARMVAMKNATDNANSLIKDLTLEYNKLRQGNITNELLEIAGGQLGMMMIAKECNMNKGKIVQVVGPVVDVEFTENLPAHLQRVDRRIQVENEPVKLTLEVQQHLGDNWVRTISMSGTEGLKRGYEVIDTGAPISMPVGEGVMGRVFDVTRQPRRRTRPGQGG